MTAKTPPGLTRKTKDRTVMAIVLTVLLHLLFAAIVYFTMFYKQPQTSPASSLSDNPVTTMPPSQPAALPETPDDNTQPLAAISLDPKTAQTITMTQNRTQQTSAKSDQTSTRSQADVISKNKDSKPASEAETTIEVPVDKETMLESNKKNTDTARQLQRTEEYNALEAEIEQDSEQLSKLIAEIKKQNQAQIEQHQTPTSKSPISADIQPNLSLADDYPITPIKDAPPLVVDDHKTLIDDAIRVNK